MNDHMTVIPPETYHALSDLLIALGAGLGIWGVLNLLDGYGNDIPAAQEQGERLLKAGGDIVIIAAYIRKGTLPEPEIMEYLASR